MEPLSSMHGPVVSTSTSSTISPYRSLLSVIFCSKSKENQNLIDIELYFSDPFFSNIYPDISPPRTNMEPPTQPRDYHSVVDTSRPFRSVKEAVAIFGERLLIGEIYHPKPHTFTPMRQESPEDWNRHHNHRQEDHQQNHEHEFLDALRKIEADLENTKAEFKLLKERESVMEVALASLNAELHKNMSKLAQVEATTAKKAAVSFKKIENVVREEERRKELMKRMENNQTLAHILSIGEEENFGPGIRERKMMKKKPIVPLVGDWFFKKKGESEYFL